MHHAGLVESMPSCWARWSNQTCQHWVAAAPPAPSPCTLSTCAPSACWAMITGQWPMAGVEKVDGACGCSGLPVRKEPAISVPAGRGRGNGQGAGMG